MKLTLNKLFRKEIGKSAIKNPLRTTSGFTPTSNKAINWQKIK